MVPPAVGTCSGGLRRGTPTEEKIRSGQYASAVIIHLGARITSAWCPLAAGLRSGAKMTSGWCRRLLVLIRAACDPAKGEPSTLEGNKDHKTLVHTSYQHSLESENNKRLVATVFGHPFWSQDDEQLMPSTVGTRSCASISPPIGGTRITSGYCTPAVSIRL